MGQAKQRGTFEQRKAEAKPKKKPANFTAHRRRLFQSILASITGLCR